jgi:hypothetical protein
MTAAVQAAIADPAGRIAVLEGEVATLKARDAALFRFMEAVSVQADLPSPSAFLDAPPEGRTP